MVTGSLPQIGYGHQILASNLPSHTTAISEHLFHVRLSDAGSFLASGIVESFPIEVWARGEEAIAPPESANRVLAVVENLGVGLTAVSPVAFGFGAVHLATVQQCLFLEKKDHVTTLL